jgi:hypothetical protein
MLMMFVIETSVGPAKAGGEGIPDRTELTVD